MQTILFKPVLVPLGIKFHTQNSVLWIILHIDQELVIYVWGWVLHCEYPRGVSCNRMSTRDGNNLSTLYKIHIKLVLIWIKWFHYWSHKKLDIIWVRSISYPKWIKAEQNVKLENMYPLNFTLTTIMRSNVKWRSKSCDCVAKPSDHPDQD